MLTSGAQASPEGTAGLGVGSTAGPGHASRFPTTSHAVSWHDHVPRDVRDTPLRSITSCCQLARCCKRARKFEVLSVPQGTSCETKDLVHGYHECLSHTVGHLSCRVQVDDETSVQTALNNLLKSLARSNRCSIHCRSRYPLTQRETSNFDVCNICLRGVSVKRQV